MTVDNTDILVELKKLIKPYSRVAIAFSGGVDSSLLLVLCSKILPGNVIAITAKTVFQTCEEIETCASFAAKVGIPHRIIPVDILEDKKIASNPPDRCYHCKRKLFETILDVAKQQGCRAVFDGTNADDTKDYRPGLKALGELGIISPFLRLGIGKEKIRKTSKEYQIPTWNQPSNACLASRISYCVPITTDLLNRIDRGEKLLKKHGFRKVRVRVYNQLACIEVERSKVDFIFENKRHLQILEDFKKLGFPVVAVDLEGFVSGKLNRKFDTREQVKR